MEFFGPVGSVPGAYPRSLIVTRAILKYLKSAQALRTESKRGGGYSFIGNGHLDFQFVVLFYTWDAVTDSGRENVTTPLGLMKKVQLLESQTIR
jgi:hypothetical protein